MFYILNRQGISIRYLITVRLINNKDYHKFAPLVTPVILFIQMLAQPIIQTDSWQFIEQ